LILFEVACFQVTAFGSVDELRLKKRLYSPCGCQGAGNGPADMNRTQHSLEPRCLRQPESRP
jgi:hypothetical protein